MLAAGWLYDAVSECIITLQCQPLDKTEKATEKDNMMFRYYYHDASYKTMLLVGRLLIGFSSFLGFVDVLMTCKHRRYGGTLQALRLM